MFLYHTGAQEGRTTRRSKDEGTWVWWCDCHHALLFETFYTSLEVGTQRHTEVGSSSSCCPSFTKNGNVNYDIVHFYTHIHIRV